MRALAAKVFSADIQITLREIAASYDALERLADDRARSPSSAARDRTVSQKPRRVIAFPTCCSASKWVPGCPFMR